MKALLFLSFFTLVAGAQTFTYDIKTFNNGEVAEMRGIPGDLFMAKVTFSNSGNTPVQVFMDRFQKSIPPYWAVCYCYIQCHSPAEDTVTVDIAPNSTTVVDIQFKTDSVNPGIATTSFKLLQKNFQDNGQTVVMSASTLNDVGINENLHINEVNVFPNPGRGHVYISAQNNDAGFEILNGQGKQVLTGPFDNGSAEISTHNLPAGLYFVRVKSDTRHITKTIVIN